MNLDGKTVYSDNADEAKNHLLDNKGCFQHLCESIL
jgi:hypothetical protein